MLGKTTCCTTTPTVDDKIAFMNAINNGHPTGSLYGAGYKTINTQGVVTVVATVYGTSGVDVNFINTQTLSSQTITILNDLATKYHMKLDVIDFGNKRLLFKKTAC